MSARVLVVDDDRAVRTVLTVNLGKRGMDVVAVETADDALRALAESPFDLILTDVRMPGRSGLDLLAETRRRWADLPVVVMTGQGSVSDAVDAMRAGANDYVLKPIERDALYLVLDRALEQRTLKSELAQLRKDIAERYGFDNLVGGTPVMEARYEEVRAVADSAATVLLQGPTGTGKELLAHAIHYRSPRAGRPFVRVNCAALPASLLESELFGHERGAFTGAVRRHLGKFEQADGGTLFLDEIGEIDLSMQVKLLRVLESGELQRVGGSDTVRVDVRVITATNRDLQAEVAERRFREDLYYRLNVLALRVPALEERRDDIPLLVGHFLRRVAAREGRPTPRITRETVSALQAASWPGNVRQLEHCVERAFVLHRGEDPLPIEPPAARPGPGTAALPAAQHSPVATGPAATAPPGAPAAPLPEPATSARPLSAPAHAEIPEEGLVAWLEAREREVIIAALERAGGVQAQAARLLGLSRSNLNYRIQRLGIVLDTVRFR